MKFIRVHSVLFQLRFRLMSTVHNTNKACCSVPPVQVKYTPKGTYKSYGGFDRVYVTGPASSTNAIVATFDIFGFVEQTLQGADIVAKALDTRVYMPDFFNGHPFPKEQYPPKTVKDKRDIQAFFGGIAKPDVNIEKLKIFAKALKGDGYKKLGAYGYCWGGKVTLCAAGKETPLEAAAVLHPAILSMADFEAVTVPVAVYPSKDEPVDEFNKFQEVLKQKPFAPLNDWKHYTTMIHGWAAARGNLEDESVRKEYDDVYNRLVKFFGKSLSEETATERKGKF